MKKKYGLFKVLTVLLLLIVVASYIFKSRGGEIKYIGLVSVFFNYIQSFYYFFDTAIFVLAIGGFYGLLNRIPAYRDLVNGIAKKFNKKKKMFIIVMTVVFALVSSLTGLNLIMLLFVPFVVSIILLLGYDKLVALSVTIGGTLVGMMAGIFANFKDASNQYAVGYTNFDKLVGLSNKFNATTVLSKSILLIVGIVLLILCILSYIKNADSKKDKYKLSKSDPLFAELKDRTGKKIDVTNKKSNKWPLIIILSIFTILIVLGYMPWKDLFGIRVFDNFHTWLTKLSIGKYVVFTNLISEQITAFGTWGNMGSYMMVIFLMCFFGTILGLIYRVKFEDTMDGFVYGVKKMIVPAMISILAYSVLVTSYNNGFMEVIIKNAGESFGDNVVIHSIITIVGSVLNVDLYYVSAGIISNIVTSLTDKANLSVYAIMFQSLNGVVQLVGPTSIILIVGLSYLEVPYKSWLKYIWRFIVELLIAIFVILMIVSLL